MTTTANGAPRTRAAAAASGSKPSEKTNGGLIIPKNSTEFHALVQQMRSHHSALHGGTADVAAFLKSNLPAEIERRGGATRGLLGLDARMMARRVVKPLHEAAKLDEEIAKLWVVSWIRFQENVLNVKTNRGSGGFNADG